MNLKEVAAYHVRCSDASYSESMLQLASKSVIQERFGSDAIMSKGGATIVIVQDDDSGRYHIGIAVCSMRDSFDRKRGLTIARARAQAGATEGVLINGPKVDNNHLTRYVLNGAIGHIHPKYLVSNIEVKYDEIPKKERKQREVWAKGADGNYAPTGVYRAD